MLRSYVSAAFVRVGNLLAGVMPKKIGAAVGMLETPSPMHAALARLAEFEGVHFCGDRDGKALFVHHSEQFSGRFSYSELPSLLSSFQEGQAVFTDLQASGKTEVDVPKDIVFHPLSARFTEMRDTPPTDRKYGTCTLGSRDGGSRKGYMTTKEKLGLDVILQSYKELIGEFESAIRAAVAKPEPNRDGVRATL